MFAVMWCVPFLVVVPYILLAERPNKAWWMSIGFIWFSTTLIEVGFVASGGVSYLYGPLFSWLFAAIWSYPWLLIRRWYLQKHSKPSP